MNCTEDNKSECSVIIVSDDAEQCQSLQADLTSLGYVAIRSSLPEVQDAVRSTQPMAVIIDPFINYGKRLEAVRLLVSTLATDKVPVLLLLAARPQIPEALKQFDMSTVGVLTHPYANGEIGAMLAHILRKSKG